jgi:hypothetical protein
MTNGVSTMADVRAHFFAWRSIRITQPASPVEVVMMLLLLARILAKFNRAGSLLRENEKVR